MGSITVFRNDGLTVGKTIVEQILSDSVLVDRGRHEMNANAEEKTIVVLSIVYREGLRLGDLVSVSDPTNIESFRGKIVGISLKLQHGSASQEIRVERVL